MKIAAKIAFHRFIIFYLERLFCYNFFFFFTFECRWSFFSHARLESFICLLPFLLVRSGKKKKFFWPSVEFALFFWFLQNERSPMQKLLKINKINLFVLLLFIRLIIWAFDGTYFPLNTYRFIFFFFFLLSGFNICQLSFWKIFKFI